MTTVHVVVPDGIDDPARPSGGNAYDRRICDGLAATGWAVHEHAVPGGWPRPDAAALATLAGVMAAIPDRSTVMIDGLIASRIPELLVPAARRLRLVVLVHMPLGAASADVRIPDARARESDVLSAAAAIVTSSSWTRCLLLERYSLRPNQIHVAEPGVDASDPAHGTATGGELLCVAAVAPHKGHDVLLAALASTRDLAWRCVCVGPLNRDPEFVDHLRGQARRAGIGGRVLFAGPRAGHDLDASYACSDVLVLASRAETYCMVVTEALAHGLPVIATEVGGLPEALGHGVDHTRPGLLVPPGDAVALASALRAWLGDLGLRQRLRRAAGERRATLRDWTATSRGISGVLAGVAT